MELIAACNIVLALLAHNAGNIPIPRYGKLADLLLLGTELNIQDALARYREHQTRRLSLPPLPEFPKEDPIPPTTEGALGEGFRRA